ncbi:MAG: hypothetical protein ING66_13000 [Rhodocyclaceae bacterium]|nr:hypothetical protein [Rhodocyclaceae bacterium]MCA3084672.1 hypothetical protein [Rhodocyclaceae bacterium]MCA3087630.1 hypothetical protein [Rhodocyclaceae bacterium]
MTRWFVLLAQMLSVAAAAAACASAPRQDLCSGGFRENSVKVRAGNPNRIDFDVCGQPSRLNELSAEEQLLPRHLQFGRVMRPYAEKRLAELRLCPRGFVGPEVVQRPRYDLSRGFFWVECL